jgi:hypothetical protein
MDEIVVPPKSFYISAWNKCHKSEILQSNLEISGIKDHKRTLAGNNGSSELCTLLTPPNRWDFLATPPEYTPPNNLLTVMIMQTGPRKLQMNPVSVFSQQLWRETGGVSTCLNLDFSVSPAPSKCTNVEGLWEVRFIWKFSW